MAVIFFDTSALVRRYDDREPGAARVQALCRLRSGHVPMISRVTSVEMASALNRKVRDRVFGAARRDRMWRLFRSHLRRQYRLGPLDEAVFEHAERLLFQHRLRGIDALQIASALATARLMENLVSDFRFCTADRAQAEAARREGLTVELIA